MKPARRVRGRVGLRTAGVVGLVLLALTAWWAGPADEPSRPAESAGPRTDGSRAIAAPLGMAASAAPAAASSVAIPSEAERQARRQDAELRLQRAQQTLDGYRQAARYPHESRPASEHPDQLRPFDPIVEDQPLRMPGGSTAQGMRLQTSQERLFLSGNDHSRVTVSLVDVQGRALPLRVQRAVLREVPQPQATARSPDLPIDLNDAGRTGDAAAGDGVFTAWVQPLQQGFAHSAGLIRLELYLEHAGQPGFLYFDFIYSPQAAARWLPGVREVLEAGSLAFHAKAEVLLPGRYVVSARVDDATGRSFALALFNGELPAGPQDIRLPVFGRLIHDEKPVFPLRLRDVDAFLLKPDTYPDRVMLPRLAGVVHTSRSYALSDFSEREWASEERTRYLTELQRDVERARQALPGQGP